ncbi:Lipopolysaccharide assembly protein B [Emticicia aquatica]|uniref:Lipopolysaccharide assembly protein B n=1 Tax=Emticicia aquatica TaxID=1681835 RepID=A0ABN8ERS5_9BACT|nr:tetratricopeptide repeat protein [Emticicia aquatica]CAH0995597.1 Lipopolysaccharide assembly protein B [Emticicia aquatica]
MNKILKSLSVSAVAILALSFQTMAQTVQDGLRNLDAERYNAAETTFKQLASIAPTAENYFYLGYYYLNLQDGQVDLVQAKEAFAKGTALDAKKPDPLCRVGLATVKLLSGDRAGAKVDFDLIKKDTKNKNADVLFRIGEAYTLSDKINDPAEAVINIQAGLDIQKVKNNPDYYIAIAMANLIKNDGGAAMTALENALNMGQKTAKIRTLMGRVWYQGKNYPKAQTEFNEAIKADPEYAPAYYYLSSLFTTFGKFPQAAENAKQALNKSEATPAAKLRYIKLATASKDYDGALNILNQIFDTEKDPIKFRLKGYIQTEKGECADGAKNILEFLGQASKERHLASDWGMLGRAYACIKDDAAKKLNDSLAVSNMEIAIEKGDSTFDYSTAIANIYRASKNWIKLAGAYEKNIASSKKGGTAPDYYNLADAYMRSRDYVKADTVYSKAIELYKDSWLFPYMQKARARQYGNPTDTTFSAAPYYDKYIKLSTDAMKADVKNAKYFSEAYGYLGYRALLIEKDTVKATEYMNMALKFDPTNTKAQQVLQSMSGATPATPGTTTPPNNNAPNGASGGGIQPKN